jgi:hypothetical protein
VVEANSSSSNPTGAPEDIEVGSADSSGLRKDRWRAMTPAEKFLQIFRARENACVFGRIGTERSAKGKVSCTYTTLHRPYTAEDVEKHLVGQVSIVAIPILLDGTCWWGSGDLDNYADLNWKKLNEQREKYDLPFYIFPSKSGGAHLFVFFPEPRPADKVRLLIQTWMAKLGVLYAPDGSVHEIFPKQTHDDEDKCGNGINLPFLGDAAGLDKFSPVTYNVPVDEWVLDAPAETKRESSGPSSDSRLKGVKLRRGWDPETRLSEAGLLYDTRTVGNTIYFDYYAEMHQCLLAGRTHDGGAMAEGLNARMSTFVYHKDTRRFYHQCFADGCRQQSNKTAAALSKLNIDLNDIVEDEDDLAMEDAQLPEYPAECLEGDAIAEFTRAVTDGTGIPPQYVYSIVAGTVLHAADRRIGYPNHENIRTNSYDINISNEPRSGKGEARKRAFDEPGLAKPLLDRTGNRGGIHLLEGTNCGSGAFAVKKISDIRQEEDKRLLAQTPEPQGGLDPDTDVGIKGAFEIENDTDVYRILKLHNIPSERDQAVKLGMDSREVSSARKRDWREAAKLAKDEIRKARDNAPARMPQPDDDYLRVCLVFDELLNAYRGGDSSVEEMLLSAYERTFLAHGSFKNDERRIDNVSLSFQGDVTRRVFEELFTGKSSANSGFLHRCKLTYGVKKRVPDWRPIDAEKAAAAVRALSKHLAALPESRIGGNKPFVPQETNDAKRMREEFFRWLDQQNPKFIPELDSHFRRYVLVRVLATGATFIDVEHVKPAIAWTKYQLALREALYPADNEDIVGQIASKMLTLLDKEPSKPWTDSLFNRTLHFNTRNHGTSEHYVRARQALLKSNTIVQFGINRKGHPMYQRSGNFVQVSPEDKQRFEAYKAEKEKSPKNSATPAPIPPRSVDATDAQIHATEKVARA